MALQIQVTGPVLTAASQDKIVQAEWILKCWKKSDNPDIDEPVIDSSKEGSKRFLVQCKTETDDNKPLAELLERAKKEIVVQMQTHINIYNKLQGYLDKQPIKDSAADIQDRLEG